MNLQQVQKLQEYRDRFAVLHDAYPKLVHPQEQAESLMEQVGRLFSSANSRISEISTDLAQLTEESVRLARVNRQLDLSHTGDLTIFNALRTIYQSTRTQGNPENYTPSEDFQRNVHALGTMLSDTEMKHIHRLQAEYATLADPAAKRKIYVIEPLISLILSSSRRMCSKPSLRRCGNLNNCRVKRLSPLSFPRKC